MSESASPPSPRRSHIVIWDLIWPLAANIAGVVFGGFVLGIGVAIAAHGVSHGAVQARQHLIAQLLSNFWVTQGFVVLLYVVFLAAIALMLRRIWDNALVAGFGLVSGPTLGAAALSGIGFVFLLVVLNGFVARMHLVTFHATHAEQVAMPVQWLQYPMSLLAVAIFAPLSEEIYFRGFLLSWLDQKFGRRIAIGGSALAFAIVHFRFTTHALVEGLFLTAMIGGLGLINALWAVRTRSLWPGVVVHAVYNAMLVSLAFLGHALRAPH